MFCAVFCPSIFDEPHMILQLKICISKFTKTFLTTFQFDAVYVLHQIDSRVISHKVQIFKIFLDQNHFSKQESTLVNQKY